MLSWKLDADKYETDPELKKIREERGYSYTVSFNFIIIISKLSLFYLLFNISEKKSLRTFVTFAPKSCQIMKRKSRAFMKNIFTLMRRSDIVLLGVVGFFTIDSGLCLCMPFDDPSA